MSKTYVHQSIARAVADHGVTTLFGLMGDANLFLVDSYVRECGGAFIPAAHEGSSVLGALAFAHVSGKVGVATVTHGPALTNCTTALTEGVRGLTPMVLASSPVVERPGVPPGIEVPPAPVPPPPPPAGSGAMMLKPFNV